MHSQRLTVSPEVGIGPDVPAVAYMKRHMKPQRGGVAFGRIAFHVQRWAACGYFSLGKLDFVCVSINFVTEKLLKITREGLI